MAESRELELSFHGRIIDHLGIQMYQSPVAALAELISNSWDADAEQVEITLPTSLSSAKTPVIRIKDNGVGMTLDQCNERFLNVGWCKRGDEPLARTEGKKRPVLGRKGIGKFAGFGIASQIEVQTISASTGEQTTFTLDLTELRGDRYVARGKKVNADYLGPSQKRKAKHGTKITLKTLTLQRAPSIKQFRNSMSRRFLLHQHAADFDILVNNKPLPKSANLAGVEYRFPNDYTDDECPDGLKRSGEWGIEEVNGKSVRWKIWFYKETIGEEELRGISVFAKALSHNSLNSCVEQGSKGVPLF